jgi:hypothetical protein
VDRAYRRVRDRHRIIEEHHDPVARELIERALELAGERPQRAVVVAQKIEHLLGFGGFGKRGVASQVAKYDDDFAAMAFEDLLVALRDDQLSKLGREEPLQSSDAPNSSTCSATRASRPRFSSAT